MLHEGLIFKLEQNEVTGNPLKLFGNYLKDREQRVVLNGTHSDVESMRSGAPQGSVLGPLLFRVYINDLQEGSKSSIYFLPMTHHYFQLYMTQKSRQMN